MALPLNPEIVAPEIVAPKDRRADRRELVRLLCRQFPRSFSVEEPSIKHIIQFDTTNRSPLLLGSPM